MSGVVGAEKKAVAGVVVPEEIEKIVISTDTVKALFKEKYGRDVESVTYDEKTSLWTVDFLMPAEVPVEEPEGAE